MLYDPSYNPTFSVKALQSTASSESLRWQANAQLTPSLDLTWLDTNILVNFTSSTFCRYNLATRDFSSHAIFANDAATFGQHHPETGLVIWVTASRKAIMIGLLEEAEPNNIKLINQHEIEVEASVTALTLSHDGLLFGTGHADGSISLWDSQTGELKFTETPHTLAVSSIIFSPDDAQFISAGRRDGNIFFWDVKSLTQMQALALKINYIPYAIAQIQMDSQGDYLIAANETLTIPIWRVADGTFVTRVNLEASHAVAMSPDNQWLVATRGSLYLWSVDEQSDTLIIGEPFTFDDIRGITRFAFNPDGNLLAVAYQDGIGVVDTTTPELIETLPGCISE